MAMLFVMLCKVRRAGRRLFSVNQKSIKVALHVLHFLVMMDWPNGEKKVGHGMIEDCGIEQHENSIQNDF